MLKQRTNRAATLAGLFIGLSLITAARAEHPKTAPKFQMPVLPTCAIAFSPDGKVVASADQEGKLALWDVATARPIGAFSQGDRVEYIRFSPDGKTVAAGSRDGAIKLWDVATGKARANLLGHTGPVLCFAFSPDSKILAAAKYDWDAIIGGQIKLWDAASGANTGTLYHGSDDVLAVAFSPNGKILASGGDQIKLWDAASGREVAVIAQPAESLAFSPDGKSFASSQTNRPEVRLWEVATAKQRAVLLWKNASPIQGPWMAFGPGTKIAVSGSEGSPRPASRKLEEWWSALAGPDVVEAYQAIQTLTAAPEQAVKLARQRLRPVKPPTPQPITRLIAALDNNRFSVRNQAREQLETLGEPAAVVLRKKLTEGPSLEVRRQIEFLLPRIERQLTSETLQSLRAIEILERIANSEAREVLETLAQGATGFRLTTEAQESLRRLTERDISKRP